MTRPRATCTSSRPGITLGYFKITSGARPKLREPQVPHRHFFPCSVVHGGRVFLMAACGRTAHLPSLSWRLQLFSVFHSRRFIFLALGQLQRHSQSNNALPEAV